MRAPSALLRAYVPDGYDMRPEITDVACRLEYGQTHDVARQHLPYALIGILLGLFLLTPFDGRTLSGKPALAGVIALLMSFVYLGFILYRAIQPSIPNIVLSPDGVLFRQVSDKPIPWNVIEEIGTAKVRASRDFFSTRVAMLVVSESYYNSLDLSFFTERVIGEGGDPSAIYISYYTPPPLYEFQTALRCRWEAFSRHAGGREARVEAPGGAAGRAPLARRPGGAIQRMESLPAARALAALVRTSSAGQLMMSMVALAGIMALGANNLGLWSTARQREGLAEAEKWRQWRLEQEARQKAFDAEQRRLKDSFDRAFRCMDRSARNDPECR